MFLKLLHITLAVAVYISTGGFAISSHHCGGHLVNISFFGVAQDCYGNDGGSPCKNSEGKPSCKKGCCENDMGFFKSDADLDTVFFDYVKIEIPDHPTIFLQHYVPPYFEKIAENNFAYLLKPPNVMLDILVRFQVFLL